MTYTGQLTLNFRLCATPTLMLICLQPLVLCVTPTTWTAAVLAAQAALQLEPPPALP